MIEYFLLQLLNIYLNAKIDAISSNLQRKYYNY